MSCWPNENEVIVELVCDNITRHPTEQDNAISSSNKYTTESEKLESVKNSDTSNNVVDEIPKFSPLDNVSSCSSYAVKQKIDHMEDEENSYQVVKQQLLNSSTVQDLNSPSQALCWSCKKQLPKYKCPCCLRRTCSVACVAHHKKVLNCNGVRNKTEFVAKEKFNENHLLSDYRFLEDVNRCATKRNNFPRPYYKNKSMRLQHRQAERMKIKLKHLPTAFKRRKENSTYYCFKKKAFLWRVDWIFSESGVIHVDERFEDTVPLLEGIGKFVQPSSGNKLYDPRLCRYSETVGISFHMKKEQTPANAIKYYKLDGSKGLRHNLEGKTIIEFPRIFVVLPGLSANFDKCLVDNK